MRYKVTPTDPVSPFHCPFNSMLLCCNAYAFCFVKLEMSQELFVLWSLVEVHVGKITANVCCMGSVKGMVLSSSVLFLLEPTSQRCSCCLKHALFFPLSKATFHAVFMFLADPGRGELMARFWTCFYGSHSFTLTAVTLERRIQPLNCKSWMVSSKVGQRKKK